MEKYKLVGEKEMKKFLHRFLVVFILLFTIFLICYTVRSCRVVNSNTVSYESLQKSTYKSKNGNILIFSDEIIWYVTEESTYEGYLKSYNDGTLIVQVDKQSFTFKVIDNNLVYDAQTKEFMYRGGSG